MQPTWTCALNSENNLRFNSRFWESQNERHDPDAPKCEWPHCADEGNFKAPKTREDLRNYRLFCLEHVRQYNKRWNFYEGMDMDDIEQDMQKDRNWQRPTWNFGTKKKHPSHKNTRFKDDYGFFNEDGSFKGEPEDDYTQFDFEQRKAFALLDLKPDVTMVELRKRYKVLVKKHHPDVNNGDKDAEERFKIINEAYTLLKNTITD